MVLDMLLDQNNPRLYRQKGLPSSWACDVRPSIDNHVQTYQAIECIISKQKKKEWQFPPRFHVPTNYVVDLL